MSFIRILHEVRMEVRHNFIHNYVLRSFISLCLCLIMMSYLCSPVQVGAMPFVFSFPAGFSLSSLVGGAAGAGVARKDGRAGVKPYTGHRVSNESLRMIYWHDQTVAVAEIGAEKVLLGCELIEVYDDEDRERLLAELSKINRPLMVTFPQMIKFMRQCKQVEDREHQRSVLERRHESDSKSMQSDSEVAVARATLEGNTGASPLSLLSGIIPGTKWCGTGDIARDYHDLGTERRIDRCCRAHDLCPVKVRGFNTRYNLTNNAVYSKSHCNCDDLLWNCLRDQSNSSAAKLMGNLYFNLAQVPCLEDTENGKRFRKAKTGF